MRAALLALALLAWPTLAGCAGARGAGAGRGPAFTAQATRALGAAGDTVELACTVRHLGDRTVSWVRARDLQILAHAGAAFTADARVSARRRADAHTLRIERLRASDAGRYECQLNTEPKMSLFFELLVSDGPVPRAVVSAARGEVVARRGAAAALECAARYEPVPLEPLPLPDLDLQWYKDDRPFSLEGERPGGVSLEARAGGAGGEARSRLTLAALSARDAGRYTCALRTAPGEGAGGDIPHAHVLLYVDDANASSEAMQRDEAARAAAPGARSAALALLVPALVLLPPLIRAS